MDSGARAREGTRRILQNHGAEGARCLLTGFYQAFFFVFLSGYLLGSLPWLEVARRLRRRLPRPWNARLRPIGDREVAVVLLLGETAQGLAAALLALTVTGSAVGIALGGLAAVVGSQWPAFGRLRRVPFHYLPLGRYALKIDRALLVTAGVLLVAEPVAACALALFWAVALLLTRYAPLGSALAALSLPVFLWRLTGYDLWVLFGMATAVISVYQQIPYLLRARSGWEPALLGPGLRPVRQVLSHRQSRRLTLAVRGAFLAAAAGLLALALFSRYASQGLGSAAGAFRRGNPDLPYVALTFDDGPDPRYTPEVLRILREKEVSATFFLVGSHAGRHPALVRRIQEEGHEIGSHTFSHRNLFLANPGLVREEVLRAEETLRRITGQRPRLFRPPRGLYDRNLVSFLAERRYTMVLWSVSSRDWVEISPRLIARNVLGPVRGGDILLFHDSGAIITSEGGNRTSMLRALPYVIDRLKAEGFRFVTVSQLLVISGLTSGGTPAIP